MFDSSPGCSVARHTSANGGERLRMGMMTNGKADLSPYPTGVAARLSAHCTFSFRRPGFLGNFSGDGTRGGRYVATDRGVVRHWGLAEEINKAEERYYKGRRGGDEGRRRRGWENRRREKGRSSLSVSDREGEKRKERITGEREKERPRKPLGNLRSGPISIFRRLRRSEKSNLHDTATNSMSDSEPQNPSSPAP